MPYMIADGWCSFRYWQVWSMLQLGNEIHSMWLYDALKSKEPTDSNQSCEAGMQDLEVENSGHVPPDCKTPHEWCSSSWTHEWKARKLSSYKILLEAHHSWLVNDMNDYWCPVEILGAPSLASMNTHDGLLCIAKCCCQQIYSWHVSMMDRRWRGMGGRALASDAQNLRMSKTWEISVFSGIPRGSAKSHADKMAVGAARI